MTDIIEEIHTVRTEEKSADTRMEENEEELATATAKKTEEPEDPEFDGDGKQNVEATNIEEIVNVPEEKSQGKTVLDDPELCQCCLRVDEEETAHLWCNDCNEAVCQSCGKAHRRFVVAHDVIPINDAPTCRKNVPKNCYLHENEKLILFCVGHDKLICHECLSAHRPCDKILEIEKAAGGVKDSAAINNLKGRMRTFSRFLEQTQIEHEQTVSSISIEKDSAHENIKEFLQCFENHIRQIRNNLNKRYENILRQNEKNGKQLNYLRKGLQENMEWLCMLERSSSESNIFHAVKHLDTIQVSDEKLVDQIKKDMITLPLDVLSSDGTTYIDKLFEEFYKKTEFGTFPAITISASESNQSQIKVESYSQSTPSRYQEFVAVDNSTFGALCFTEDGRIVVEELFQSKQTTHFLRIFDLITDQSLQIKLRELYYGMDMKSGSICIYDEKFALITSNKVIGIMVIDLALERHCRTIILNHSRKIKRIKWVTCKEGEIYLLAESKSNSWLCSIDFNGTTLSELKISGSVAHMDFEDSKRFFHTDNQVNDIHCTSTDKACSTSKCYSSLDLRVGCSILHITGDELLLLEKDSNTVYKLDISCQRRSILLKDDIENPTHFNLSLKFKKIAITMNGGKCIRIFNFE